MHRVCRLLRFPHAAAVSLNYEFPVEASEVHISSDRHLALELVASKPMSAKVIPEPPFGVAHFAPK
jgi:hypothetical protein